jgi:hypothetical protein
MEQINKLLEKYDHFKYARIRSVESPADRSIVIINIDVEDDEGEVENSVSITFTNVKETRLLQNSVLPFLDMMSGISIVQDHDLYGFALGSDTAMLHVHNAPMYVIASDINIEEKQ